MFRSFRLGSIDKFCATIFGINSCSAQEAGFKSPLPTIAPSNGRELVGLMPKLGARARKFLGEMVRGSVKVMSFFSIPFWCY